MPPIVDDDEPDVDEGDPVEEGLLGLRGRVDVDLPGRESGARRRGGTCRTSSTMFCLLTLEAGSEEGRMSWAPWQLAQLATATEPPFTASPWKLSSKVLKRSLSMPYFSERRSEPWQGVQTFCETLAAATGESGSLCFRMPCSPWQVVQVGASRTPFASAFPWALFAKTPSMLLWHLAQIFSMASGFDAAPGAERFRTVWAPWQSTQLAAFSLPARRARPWTLFSYCAMKPALGATRARTSGLSRWQRRQSFSWACFAVAAGAPSAAEARRVRWQVRQVGASFTFAAAASAVGGRRVEVHFRLVAGGADLSDGGAG